MDDFPNPFKAAGKEVLKKISYDAAKATDVGFHREHRVVRQEQFMREYTHDVYVDPNRDYAPTTHRFNKTYTGEVRWQPVGPTIVETRTRFGLPY